VVRRLRKEELAGGGRIHVMDQAALCAPRRYTRAPTSTSSQVLPRIPCLPIGSSRYATCHAMSCVLYHAMLCVQCSAMPCRAMLFMLCLFRPEAIMPCFQVPLPCFQDSLLIIGVAFYSSVSVPAQTISMGCVSFGASFEQRFPQPPRAPL